ncbi:MAG TPA: class I SAM-dependent methyltransferase [Longimicrobiaceae bacterium]|nr:class I SAM-dependent methyltransferase [Longimicrobiaceae bacterium]
MSLDGVRAAEREYWDTIRAGQELYEVDVERVRRELLAPCFTSGVDWYSDNKKAFHERFLQERWKGKHVLDYGCGSGVWSAYFALTGAARVTGFDLSPVSVAMGQERVRRQGLQDRVRLMAMDATALGFSDDAFDLVIGHGVIHHVIKYPNIFEELWRVMAPGGRAYFSEGLADFPLWRLWWTLKGEVPDGDVPIFSREVREKAHMFSDVQIHGDNFVYSLKRLLWKRQPSAIRRGLLRACHLADEALFAAIPPLRRWGSYSYIVLVK